MTHKKNEMQISEGDPLIPILNLVCMLIPLLLYGAIFVRYQALDVHAPKPCVGDGCSPPPEISDKLDLAVMVTEQGFHIKVNPKFRQSWMVQAAGAGGIGPDIPKKDEDWDFEALHRRLRELKSLHKTDMNIVLGAEDDVSYEVIIKTMDYSRGTANSPLFPNVQLSRGWV